MKLSNRKIFEKTNKQNSLSTREIERLIKDFFDFSRPEKTFATCSDLACLLGLDASKENLTKIGSACRSFGFDPKRTSTQRFLTIPAYRLTENGTSECIVDQ